MRKFIPLAAALALPLAACATSPYGYNSGYSNPLATVLGVLGSGQTGYGYNNYGASFSQAAVSACANVAARYGQPSVTQVRQVSSSTLRVYGRAMTGYSSRSWDCDFRSDGRITDFDI